nr:polysaccharide deacetylase family protein [bacterium]
MKSIKRLPVVLPLAALVLMACACTGAGKPEIEPTVTPAWTAPAATIPPETPPLQIPPLHTQDEKSITVYLTFDDGPSIANTERILDILVEKNVKATFFTVRYFVDAHPELVRRMYAQGHTVGCHSYSHVYDSLYADAVNFEAELDAWEKAMIHAVGEVPASKVFRFPGGSTEKNKAYRYVLKQRGYRGYDWNALNNDCLLSAKPEEMTEEQYLYESFVTTVEYSFSLDVPHIILMHETYSQSADMLAWAIDYLRGLGCAFSTIDTLAESWYYR